jgi:hypothetical protein
MCPLGHAKSGQPVGLRYRQLPDVLETPVDDEHVENVPVLSQKLSYTERQLELEMHAASAAL